jgi:hypothetical protein
MMARRPAWRDHVRRGIAIGIAASLHLLVLILVVGPKTDWQDDAKGHRADVQRLQLRFLRKQATSHRHPTEPALRAIATRSPAQPGHKTPSSKPAAVQDASPAGPVMARPVVSEAAVAPANNPGVEGDGGFHQRLFQSQGLSATRAVPGSDAPLVAGIHLADPASQGIGAVARKAQRLFGITNRHCIDVATWRNLTPQERSDRHISSDELDRLDEEYHCNAPMGLAF